VCVHWLADISENCVTVDSKFCFDNVYFCAPLELMRSRPVPASCGSPTWGHWQVNRSEGRSPMGFREFLFEGDFPKVEFSRVMTASRPPLDTGGAISRPELGLPSAVS
jgi:hypothetical protein